MRASRTASTVLAGLLLLGLQLALPCLAEDISVLTRNDGGVRVSLEPQPDQWPPRVGRQVLMSLEVNAHAPDWLNVPQRYAQIDHRSAGGDALRTFSGSLRIPGELAPGQGSFIDFSEQIKLEDASLLADYEMQSRGTVMLCGLQLSAYLDAGAYKGAQVAITGVAKPPEGFAWEKWALTPITVVAPAAPAAPAPGMPKPPEAEGDEVAPAEEGDDEEAAEGDDEEAAEPAEAATGPAGVTFTEAEAESVVLPANADDNNWQLFDGFCSQIQITAPQAPPLTIKAPGVCRFVIQDNRKWGLEVFEVRVAFLMNNEGLQLSRDDTYKTQLDFNFGEGNKLKFVAAETQ